MLAANVSAAWRGCGRFKTEHANTKLTLNLKTMLKSTKLTRNLAKLMLVAVFSLTIFSCQNEEDKIKVGQTWKVVLQEKNPYEKPTFLYRKVIDIQGDYVQYIENKKDTLNDSKYWFLVSAELVEDWH